jgi:drug/metabolite transporter (DMT)-like permease
VDGAGNLPALYIVVSERLKEASMRIRTVTFAETAVVLAFGLAVLFWWEVAEPVRSASWRGSAEQWLALAAVGIGVCATLVAVGGALFALLRRDD